MSITCDWSASWQSSFTRSTTGAFATGLHASPDEFNILSFLATAQSLNIEFLPVIWDAARDTVGAGGTSSVTQSLANRSTSLAFKRVSHKDQREKPEEQIYRSLIQELIVLGHPNLVTHANIVQLLGLCWDISGFDGKPWPVFVFEKSRFGDLGHFLDSDEGRNIDSLQRYTILLEIAQAIQDMHTLNIIHGDIKPENILVFADGSGRYTVRVTDFGYSTRYGSESHPLKLPISVPWNAPEHDRLAKEWTPAQAKLTDMYSFGLVSFWLMFHPWLRGDMPWPQDNRCVSPTLETMRTSLNETALDHLITLKESREITTQSERLVFSEDSLLGRYQTALKDFFATSLSLNPGDREATLQRLLAEQEYIEVEDEDSYNDTRTLTVTLPQGPFRSSDFKLSRSLFDFYRSDFRLRCHVAARIIDEHIRTGNLRAQAAVCHHIGFGSRRDEEETLRILNHCEESKQSFESELAACLQPWESKGVWKTGLLIDLEESANIDWLDLAGEWQEEGILEEAEAQLEQEMKDLDASLSNNHTLILLSRKNLSAVYRFRRRWRDAESLTADIIKILEVHVGENHADTFVAMSHMATLLQGQNRWRDAEDLLSDIVQRSRDSLGNEHAHTLTYQLRLAWVYIQRNRLRDAEKLTREIMLTAREAFGDDHPKTLAATDTLCCVLRDQGQHRDAVDLGRQLVELSSRSMGTSHPITQQAMSNLAEALWHEGIFDEAEELERLYLDAITQSLGPDHPTTIIVEENLAGTLWSKGRQQEAEELERAALEKSIRVLGVTDPTTYGIAANLAMELAKQTRWAEAQELALRILNNEVAVEGPQAHGDLHAQLCLVNILFVMGNRPKSIAVLSQILEGMLQDSGPDDPEVCRLGSVLEKWRRGIPVREAMLVFGDSGDFPIPPSVQED